ncbi:MAG: malonyl-ACP O-methyltransferase BioC [Omnitrophica bacterium]|nr:malonyl-ACP O-methyltransferase BioC [Candidatus Omnitrophota bacterium]
MVKKTVIKNNFSRNAESYDKYSSVQRNSARKLISILPVGEFKKILDIGCGTGLYTGFLRERFRSSNIKALDISREMIEIAKDKLRESSIEFVVGDAEKAKFSENYDLITSNASFQWFDDLGKVLRLYKKLLNEKGIMLFSIFGPRTFYELNESLRTLFGKDIATSSSGFIEKPEIKNILERHFANVSVDEEIYEEKHNSVKELLQKIKYSGIRGYGTGRKGFWTSQIIGKLDCIYKERFPSRTATYQVFFCRGEK